MNHDMLPLTRPPATLSPIGGEGRGEGDSWAERTDSGAAQLRFCVKHDRSRSPSRCPTRKQLTGKSASFTASAIVGDEII